MLSTKYFADDLVVLDGDHVTLTETEDGYCALHIDHVTESDVGLFRCVLRSVYGEQETRSSVTVEKE